MSFYDDNELIAFPLVGDDDNRIPSDLIVDCIVHAPASLGTDLILRSLSVTGMLVSCVLAIDDTDAAYITLQLENLQTHQPLPLTPIVMGVSGFIAFGEGVTRQLLRLDGTYNFLPASLISYEYDITNPTVEVGGNEFFGLVDLDVGPGLSITAQMMNVKLENDDIVEVTAAVIAITDPALYDDPIPQCLRPAEGNPRVPPITDINGVQPSCDGDITLEFVTIREIPSDPGVTVESKPQGLTLLDEGQPCV